MPASTSNQSSPALDPDLETRLVTPLHFNELSAVHVFHTGVLWVGKNKATASDFHKVEVYDRTGSNLLATVRLNHTPHRAWAFDDSSIIVIGKANNSEGYLENYVTIIRRSGNSFRSEARRLADDYQTDLWAGNASRGFFNLRGDSSVIECQGTTRCRPLKGPIANPSTMAFTGKYLFVTEGNGPGWRDENIVRVDLENNTVDRVFKDYYRQGITEVLHVPGTDVLAANEILTGKVLLVDENTNSLLSEIEVPTGDVRAIAPLGHCVLAASSEEQRLTVIDVKTPARPSILEQWDLRPIGPTLRRPNAIATDLETQTIYVRSTDACPSCNPLTHASVVTLRQKSGRVFNSCLAR
jgi:hypothetical protein